MVLHHDDLFLFLVNMRKFLLNLLIFLLIHFQYKKIFFLLFVLFPFPNLNLLIPLKHTLHMLIYLISYFEYLKFLLYLMNDFHYVNLLIIHILFSFHLIHSLMKLKFFSLHILYGLLDVLLNIFYRMFLLRLILKYYNHQNQIHFFYNFYLDLYKLEHE